LGYDDCDRSQTAKERPLFLQIFFSIFRGEFFRFLQLFFAQIFGHVFLGIVLTAAAGMTGQV